MSRRDEFDLRLKRTGKDRRWLAERTGYSYFSVRDALAPASPAGISEKMAEAFDLALAEVEAEEAPPPADILAGFTPEERKAIHLHATREGVDGSHAWIVAKIKALLAMLGSPK